MRPSGVPGRGVEAVAVLFPMSSRKASLLGGRCVHHDSFDGSYGWRSFVDPQGPVIPIDTFCASTPGPPVMEHYGFSVDNICSRTRHLLLDTPEEIMMRVGIAADHGAFSLKRQLDGSLRSSGYEVVDFGAYELNPADDYPDFIIPLARAVAAGDVERGIALCGSGVGASIAANKVAGVRAGLIHDVFSARQGVEDDDMNVFCLGERSSVLRSPGSWSRPSWPHISAVQHAINAEYLKYKRWRYQDRNQVITPARTMGEN